MKFTNPYLKLLSAAVCALTLSFHAHAQEISKQEYILGNTLLTLYHEFGHALVTELDLPVLGKEEDAADSFSIVTIVDKLSDAETYDDQQAVELDTYLWATADGWLAFADMDEPEEGSYAGEHSLDIQRFYAHVCLVYGSDPEFHEALLEDLQVEPEFVEGCEERFELAYDNWDYMLEPTQETSTTDISIGVKSGNSKTHKKYAAWLKKWSWLEDFEKSMEQRVDLPEPIQIQFQSCDDENAYWDPENRQITFCYELMDVYAKFYESAE